MSFRIPADIVVPAASALVASALAAAIGFAAFAISTRAAGALETAQRHSRLAVSAAPHSQGRREGGFRSRAPLIDANANDVKRRAH